MIDPQQWTPDILAQYSLDPRQFADFRESVLPNGMRIIDAYNASGLQFTLLPDRGLDIWTAHYKGIPLTWIAQGSPYPPDFGQTWLQQFNGGLMTTCGLTHVGPPEKGEVTGEVRDLHGRYSRLRAENVAKILQTDSSGLPCIELSGIVRETALFGVQLRLTRTYRLSLTGATIELNDVVINLGDTPAPLMMVYHTNVGFPLVGEGTELHTPHQTIYARDAEAQPGLVHWNIYDAPSAEYKEQVFFHHLKESGGKTGILLENGVIGFEITWNPTAMPYFTQWKNTRNGIYVCGVEPGNAIPEGRTSARKTGRLEYLAPGETRAFGYTIRIAEGVDALQSAKAQIEKLRTKGTPAAKTHLDDYSGK